MDHIFDGLEEYGVNTEVGIGYTGNRDKYVTAIERYCNSYESNRSRILKDLDAMDVEDYTIAVHALKSNSRMIGAGELSSRFEALEMAGRNGNTGVMTSDTPGVLEAYDLLVNRLKPFIRAGEASTVDKIDAETAGKVCEELLGALDEYDDELSASLAAKLTGYDFGAGERDMLDKAIDLIGNFMYDEAAEIIKTISDSIV